MKVPRRGRCLRSPPTPPIVALLYLDAAQAPVRRALPPGIALDPRLCPDMRWRRHPLPSLALFVMGEASGAAPWRVRRSGHTPGLNQVRSSCWRSTCHAACAPQMCRPTAWPSRKRRRAFIDNQPEGIPVDWHVASTGLAEIVALNRGEFQRRDRDNFTIRRSRYHGHWQRRTSNPSTLLGAEGQQRGCAQREVNLQAGREGHGGPLGGAFRPDPAAAQSYQLEHRPS